MTKSEVIALLHDNHPDVNTLDYYIVKYEQYFANKEDIAILINRKFNGVKLAIRSSCRTEDTLSKSNAGKYVSVLDVDSVNTEMIIDAIDRVYDSYDSVEKEQVLVQPMLSGIVKSGVVFTRDLYSLAPYYIIDLSDGNDSSAVTSGYSTKDKVTVIYRNKKDILNPELKSLIDIIRRIESIFNSDSLDIEVAITSDHRIWILQVRPIASKVDCELSSLDEHLRRIGSKIEKLMRPRPFLLGNTTYFDVMSDWNPAEILGIRPKKLAISLYKELITDSIWAHQRENYGYRDVTKHPLMVLFCGIPFIDTRVTFNSFVPASLNNRIAEKLVNYYLEKLRRSPINHDKIEFEIVFSCYYLGVSRDLQDLLDYGFNENEIKRIEYSLLDLTNKIINPQNGLYKADILKIDELTIKHQQVMDSDVSTVEKIYWLIEICKTYGTLPFAGVARAAFIAVQFLKSLVKEQIITQLEYDRFMQTMNTISKQIGADRSRLAKGELTKELFLKMYGHIRPGTYDIQSARYDEAFDFYFDNVRSIHEVDADNEYFFSEHILKKINDQLEQNGIEINSQELIQFIKESIEGRENLKFIFTKTVSEILRLIENLGDRFSIDKNDLAHVDLSLIKSLYSDLYGGNVATLIRENIKINREEYLSAKFIKLPSIIISPSDVYQFQMLEEEPNYITTNSAMGDIVLENDIHNTDIVGRIVFIKSADPGYDFLFTKGMAALITQFGGANSHMAIRCAEIGLPAVIGAGEKNFEEWQHAKKLFIDCKNRNVRVIE